MSNRIATRIIFVRHGESGGNVAGLLQGRGNSELNEIGQRQAQAAAEFLKDERITGACSSDLKRAVQTAEIILSRHPGVKLETTPDLEEWNVGIYDGKSQMELLQNVPEVMNRFRFESGDFDVPGGESRQEFQQRVSRCIDAQLEKNRGGCLLLVAHGWTAHRILAHMYGPPRMGMVLPVPDNTGISVFNYFNEEKRFQLITWNSTAHLQGLPKLSNPVDR